MLQFQALFAAKDTSAKAAFCFLHRRPGMINTKGPRADAVSASPFSAGGARVSSNNNNTFKPIHPAWNRKPGRYPGLHLLPGTAAYPELSGRDGPSQSQEDRYSSNLSLSLSFSAASNQAGGSNNSDQSGVWSVDSGSSELSTTGSEYPVTGKRKYFMGQTEDGDNDGDRSDQNPRASHCAPSFGQEQSSAHGSTAPTTLDNMGTGGYFGDLMDAHAGGWHSPAQQFPSLGGIMDQPEYLELGSLGDGDGDGRRGGGDAGGVVLSAVKEEYESVPSSADHVWLKDLVQGAIARENNKPASQPQQHQHQFYGMESHTSGGGGGRGKGSHHHPGYVGNELSTRLESRDPYQRHQQRQHQQLLLQPPVQPLNSADYTTSANTNTAHAQGGSAASFSTLPARSLFSFSSGFSFPDQPDRPHDSSPQGAGGHHYHRDIDADIARGRGGGGGGDPAQAGGRFVPHAVSREATRPPNHLFESRATGVTGGGRDCMYGVKREMEPKRARVASASVNPPTGWV